MIKASAKRKSICSFVEVGLGTVDRYEHHEFISTAIGEKYWVLE